MAVLTFKIDDDSLAHVTEAICTRYGYEPMITVDNNKQVANPVTPAMFVVQAVERFLSENVTAYDLSKAQAQLNVKPSQIKLEAE